MKGIVPSSNNPNVIFDLDGTLVDSAESILSCFESVISSAGYELKTQLDRHLIGPPLPQILGALTGEHNPDRLNVLVGQFKTRYDNEGYRNTRAYPGIDLCLKSLKASGLKLHVATNKRLKPTLKILDFLGWGKDFDQVYAIDKFPDSPFRHKTAMLEYMREYSGIDPQNSAYVGDRLEDYQAATENRIPFVMAAWGYGDYEDLSLYQYAVTTPLELQRVLASL